MLCPFLYTDICSLYMYFLTIHDTCVKMYACIYLSISNLFWFCLKWQINNLSGQAFDQLINYRSPLKWNSIAPFLLLSLLSLTTPMQSFPACSRSFGWGLFLIPACAMKPAAAQALPIRPSEQELKDALSNSTAGHNHVSNSSRSAAAQSRTNTSTDAFNCSSLHHHGHNRGVLSWCFSQTVTWKVSCRILQK